MADTATGTSSFNNGAQPSLATKDVPDVSNTSSAPIAAPDPQVTSGLQTTAPAPPPPAEPPIVPEVEKKETVPAAAPLGGLGGVSSALEQKEEPAAPAPTPQPQAVVASEPETKAAPIPVNPVDDKLPPPLSTEPQLGIEKPATPVANGHPKDEPKPATVEEVKDEALPGVEPVTKPIIPTAPSLQPEDSDKEPIVEAPIQPAAATEQPEADMSGALQSEKLVEIPTEKPSEPVTGEKRKADEAALEANGDPAPGAVAAAPVPEEKAQDKRAQKKQKTEELATNGTKTKAEKPKKQNKVKKAFNAVIGRTARKTRSQGAADASGI